MISKGWVDLADHKDKKIRKVLNIIYFVDASKTRTVRLQMNLFATIAIVMTGLVIWSFTSFYFIDRHVKREKELTQKLRTAMDTIFEYQSRYDGVYEKAYPRSIPMDANQENNLAKKELSQEIKTTGHDSSPESHGTRAKHFHNLPLSFSLSAKKDTSFSSENLQLENPIARILDQKLSLDFGLKNLSSPKKVDGKISGALIFELPKGKLVKVLSLPHQPHSAKRSNKFSIRYFKQKKLHFELTNLDSKAVFVGIQLSVTQSKKHDVLFDLVPSPQYQGKKVSIRK